MTLPQHFVQGLRAHAIRERGIGRESDGARIMKLGRWRKLTVNGQAVEGEAPLRDGDLIRLAGEEIVFHAPEPAPTIMPVVAMLGPKPR